MAFSSSSADTHAHSKTNTIDTPTRSCDGVPASSPALSQSQIYSCPRRLGNMFPLKKILSRCSSFFHFSGLRASSHNSGSPDNLSFSHFTGENKGALFRWVQRIKPGAFTHRCLEGCLCHAPPSITTAGRSDK